MTTFSIDPGMRECGWSVLEADHICVVGTIYTVPDREPKARLLIVVNRLREVYADFGCTGVVCESFRDQGQKRNTYLYRWQTPQVIGAIQATWPDVVMQDSSIVSPNGPMRDYIERWRVGQTGLVPGDECVGYRKCSDHARDAAAHGVYFEMNRGRE